ncbi:MAG: Sec-independent protein translocase, TatC subunit [Thermoleophilia bacterium]|nr:Sec-independent protein translocase, TatC subunit [Thermoleophilia bacterium]
MSAIGLTHARRLPRALRSAFRGPRRTQVAADEQLKLVDHLGELRRRLVISCSSLLVGFVGVFLVHTELIALLNEPLNGLKPVTLGVAEPFMTAVKVSFMGAIGIALPILLWQLWGFIAPACEAKWRRSVAGYVATGTILFITGVTFAYIIALPQAVGFLINFDSQLYDVQVRAQEYYTFAAAVLLSVGLVFQLPVVLVSLVRFRVLKYETLRSNRRIAYVALVGLAVLMPGVDPVTTSMWIVPLAIFYEVSILLARRWDKQRIKREALASS